VQLDSIESYTPQVKYLLLFSFFISTVFAESLSEKRHRLNQFNNKASSSYFDKLPPSEQNIILKAKEKMNKDLGLQLLFNGNNDAQEIILLVQGHPVTPREETLGEWNRALLEIYKKNYQTYFFSINKDWKIKTNAKFLKEGLDNLLRTQPKKIIKIFGYSAGGTVSLSAKNSFFRNNRNIELHTIAAPLFGFGAPSILRWISFNLSIDMGLGITPKDYTTKIENCFHHITTNCELDVNACSYSDILSQISEDMPCGINNTLSYPSDTHQSIINKVINDNL
jgi:hypothetical protein